MRLIDTDVLINLSRGKLGKSIVRWDKSECISDISYMEFVQGCRNNQELIIWKKASNQFKLIPVTEDVSHKARSLMDDYKLAHGINMGDALIAATALVHSLTLLTGNKKHYCFIPGLDAEYL